MDGRPRCCARPYLHAALEIADCSDLTIVATWARIGLPGKRSAVSRSEQSRTTDEHQGGGTWLVAAGPWIDGR